MTNQSREQLITLAIYAIVVLVTIIATVVLAIDRRLDQPATAILSTALGFSGGRAASVSTRRRSTDNGDR